MGSWLDIRVVYLRVSQCSRDENPEILTIKFPSQRINAALEVNGGRISPTEEALITLRRDRLDTESLEATYVSTDKLKATGFLPFEVDDGNDIIVSGALQQFQQSDPASDVLSHDSRYSGWNMVCGCALGPSGCVFTKNRQDFETMQHVALPTLEIGIVGRYNGSPTILTQSIQLITRRKDARCGKLHTISEVEEYDLYGSNLMPNNRLGQTDGKVDVPQKFHNSHHQATEDDDGDVSWFNAGVRVGVGIGLGVCLGIGIGVGLIVHTYQTTKSFKRRIL